MYKKTGRTLSFIMALALILSLFAGVMAEGEQDVAEVEEEIVALEEENAVVELLEAGYKNDGLLEASYTQGGKVLGRNLTVNVIDDQGETLTTQNLYVNSGSWLELSVVDSNYKVYKMDSSNCTYPSAIFYDKYTSGAVAIGSGETGVINLYVIGNGGSYSLGDIITMNSKLGRQVVKFRLYDKNNNLLDENTQCMLQRTANWTTFNILNSDYKIVRVETDGATFAKNLVNCTDTHLEGNLTIDRDNSEIKVFVEDTDGAPLLEEVYVDVDRFVGGFISQSLCDEIIFTWNNGAEEISKSMVGNDFTNQLFKLPKGVDITVTPDFNDGLKYSSWKVLNLMSGVTLTPNSDGSAILHIDADTRIINVRLQLKGEPEGTGTELKTNKVNVSRWRFDGIVDGIDMNVCEKVTFSWEEEGETKYAVMTGEGFSNSTVEIPRGAEITVTPEIKAGFKFTRWELDNRLGGSLGKITLSNSNQETATLEIAQDWLINVSLQLHVESANDIPEGDTFNLCITRNRTDKNGATLSEPKNCDVVEFTWDENGTTKAAYMAGNMFGRYDLKLPYDKNISMKAVMNSGYAFDEWRAIYANDDVLLDGSGNNVSESNPVTLFVPKDSNLTGIFIGLYSQRGASEDTPSDENLVPFSVWHYYGSDASPERDMSGNVPVQIDTMKLFAGTTAAGYKAEKDGFDYSGYSVLAQMEAGKPMVELNADANGKFDLEGALEVRVHISYDKTQTPPETPQTGKLAIGKTASFSDDGLNPSKFVFKYKITAADSKLTGNFKYTWVNDEVTNNSNVTFKNGVADLEVRGGGSKTIQGLPVGSYTVLETGVRASNYNVPTVGSYTIKGLDFTGYTRATTANGEAGVTAVVSVETEKTASVNFINTYTKNGTEPTVNHTLTYDANGGANAPAAVTKPEGTEVNLDSGSALTHANQGSTKVIFAGWTMTDTNEKVYTKNDTAPSYVAKVTLDTDKTVYAVWSLDTNDNDIPDVNETKYTITYKDGTSVLDQQKYLEGENITPIANPSKTDYRFDGWNPQVPAKMPGNDLTVNAQWTYTGGGQPPIDPPVITTYSVNYNGNGNTEGTVPTDSNSYLYNANVIVKGNDGSLKRTDTVFMGFSRTVNAVLNSQAAENAAGIIGSFSITGNTTLYAVWAVDVNHNDIPDYKEQPTIPDEPTPGDPGDVNPGDDTEIPDDDTPLNPKPGNDGDNDIKDDDVPLGELPKTGDSSNPWYLIAVMAAAMAGMVYMVFGKKARRG